MNNCTATGPPCVFNLPQHRSTRRLIAANSGVRAERLAAEGLVNATVQAAVPKGTDALPSAPGIEIGVSLALGVGACVCCCMGAWCGWPKRRATSRRVSRWLGVVAVLIVGVASLAFSADTASSAVSARRSVDSLDTSAGSSVGVERPPWPSLARRAYEPLPLGSVTPRGWLATQLLLQAEGLSGHLGLHWGRLVDSVWIGGTRGDVGGLHENTPYWLNGIVPLYYLLRNVALDAGTWDTLEKGHGRSHRSVVHDLRRQVDQYVDGILARQQPDGWLGPPARKGGNAYWARATLMLALAQLAEAEPERAPTIIAAMLRYAWCLERQLRSQRLGA